MGDKKPLVVIGGGGFGREVIWLARDCGDLWQLQAVLDDDASLHGQSLCDVPVAGGVDMWRAFPDASFVVAVGSPRTRKKIVAKMESSGKPAFASLVHPSVMKSDYVSMGDGCIIAAGCILTTQISLGNHVILNLGCTVGHDVTLGHFCTASPQVIISGNVRAGNGVELGTGCAIIQQLTVGDGAFVGAGAVVSKDIPENVLVVGSPARHVRALDEF